MHERAQRWGWAVLVALLLVTLAGVALFFYRQAASGGSIEIALPSHAGGISVEVTGEVIRPGVYILPSEADVADAIEAAGGFAPDADNEALKLLAPVRNGESIYVYRIGDIPQRININTADPWLLEALPGIGEELARRIIEYRRSNGPFQDIEDLREVKGIGPSTFEDLQDKITVR